MQKVCVQIYFDSFICRLFIAVIGFNTSPHLKQIRTAIERVFKAKTSIWILYVTHISSVLNMERLSPWQQLEMPKKVSTDSHTNHVCFFNSIFFSRETVFSSHETVFFSRKTVFFSLLRNHFLVANYIFYLQFLFLTISLLFVPQFAYILCCWIYFSMCIDFVTSFDYSIVCVAQTVSLLFAVVVVVVSSQIHLTTFQVMLLSFFSSLNISGLTVSR